MAQGVPPTLRAPQMRRSSADSRASTWRTQALSHEWAHGVPRVVVRTADGSAGDAVVILPLLRDQMAPIEEGTLLHSRTPNDDVTKQSQRWAQSSLRHGN